MVTSRLLSAKRTIRPSLSIYCFNINAYWLFKLKAGYNDGFGAQQSVYNALVDLEPYLWLFAAKATVNFSRPFSWQAYW